MINILIFSKNRPMQLELLLRSMQDNLIDVDKYFVSVYHKTDEEFQDGYLKTFEEILKAFPKNKKLQKESFGLKTGG